MWGAIIGAATGIAGQAIGAAKSAKANRKARAELDREKSENEAWYNRRYNEDYLNTATAQHALSQAREEAMRQVQRARGVQAVMGGTDESVSQAQQNANGMLAQTEAGLAAQGQARKEAVEQQYLTRANDIANRYMTMYSQQAKNAAAAGSGAMQAGMGLVGADMTSTAQTGNGVFDNWFKKKNSQNTAGGLKIDPKKTYATGGAIV